MSAAGVASRSFPPATPVVAAEVHALALPRLPLVLAVVVASLCASLILSTFTWIS